MTERGRVENLTPWKKGQSGNPVGRKKGSRNRATLLKLFMEYLDDDPTAGGTIPRFKNGRVKGVSRLLAFIVKRQNRRQNDKGIFAA